jgi:hypothetical protein
MIDVGYLYLIIVWKMKYINYVGHLLPFLTKLIFFADNLISLPGL